MPEVTISGILRRLELLEAKARRARLIPIPMMTTVAYQQQQQLLDTEWCQELSTVGLPGRS
jgi:hypothetical protein